MSRRANNMFSGRSKVRRRYAHRTFYPGLNPRLLSTWLLSPACHEHVQLSPSPVGFLYNVQSIGGYIGDKPMMGRYPTNDLWILWGPRIFYIVEVGHVSLPVENHNYPKVCKLVYRIAYSVNTPTVFTRYDPLEWFADVVIQR